jgi:site-specific recombinase XerD
MKFSLVYQPTTPAGASPYRLLDEQGRPITWANDFLDTQRVRQLSLRSLRAYGYDLLHFARWCQQHPSRTLLQMDESALFDYVRDQLNELPKPTPPTINHRLSVLRSLYRFHAGHPLPAGSHQFQSFYHTRSPLGYGRVQRVMANGLRLKEPKRVILPLSADEVAKFWSSFRTFRDLALVALMLLDGLRSQETLALQLQDLHLAQAQIRVFGKGNKQRLLPLPAETVEVLQNYLRLERPWTNSSILFISLKGPHRGQPMTLAGLRSLFRHHRCCSEVLQANPHRFRHTFGADMVRNGISLPALQQLMGHAHIRTTMRYVQLAPQDVWCEYARAVQNRIRLSLPRDL